MTKPSTPQHHPYKHNLQPPKYTRNPCKLHAVKRIHTEHGPLCPDWGTAPRAPFQRRVVSKRCPRLIRRAGPRRDLSPKTTYKTRKRFPRDKFKLSCTPVSRCFASFPHGTCPLSVSRHYSALEDVYLPLCAALPSNATLRTCVDRGLPKQTTHGILTLSDAPFQGTSVCPPL